MRLIFTLRAKNDLALIAEYIAQDNPRRALSFTREIWGKCMSLEHFPANYPIMHRYVNHAVRKMVHGSYLIFYTCEIDSITVLHIMHGASDYTDIF